MWTFFHGPDMSLSLVSSYALVTHLVLLVTDLAAYELDTLPSLHFPGRIIFHKVKGQRSLQGRSLIRLPRMHLAGNLGLQPQSWPGSWSWPTTRWSRPTAWRSRPTAWRSRPTAWRPRPTARRSRPTTRRSRPTTRQPINRRPGLAVLAHDSAVPAVLVLHCCWHCGHCSLWLLTSCWLLLRCCAEQVNWSYAVVSLSFLVLFHFFPAVFGMLWPVSCQYFLSFSCSPTRQGGISIFWS